MGATLTTFDSVLKNDYLPPLRDTLNNATVLLARVQRNEKDVFGKKVVIPIRYQRSAGVGARSEGGSLPNAGNQGYIETNPAMKYIYGRIQITGVVMKAARSDRGAFVRAVDSEVRGMEGDLKRDINRQLFRAGAGIRAICGTTSGSSTVQLAAGTDMRWLQVGMKIDILNYNTGAAVTNGTNVGITAVDRTNLTITVDGGVVTTSASHAIYGASTRNLEMTGLDGIVNNKNPNKVDGDGSTSTGVANLQGLDASTYDFWNSTVTSNSGTAGTPAELALDNMQAVIDDTEIASGKVPDLIICQHRVRAAYVKLLEADRRFSPKPLDLDGGFAAISYTSAGKDIPIVVDRDCYPGTTMYFLSEEDLTIYRQADFDWMDEDGSVLFRVANTDAYEATLFTYMEQGTPQRNAHGRLNDISIRTLTTSAA